MSEPVPEGPDVARRVEIDRDRRQVTLDGRTVALGARAFDVLRLLADHAGDVVSKAQILDTVWGGLAVEEGNLSVQISALRKVLGAGAIATVPGIGYQLVALDAPAQSGPKAAPPPLPDKPSLVVLPFANLTGGDDTDYLVDGIVRDVITALTRISALFVIAATTSFRFKGQAVDLAALGQQLGVRYAVEGSVQKAGDRLRIAVHLVATETGHMIWSEQVDGATTDLFDLQDEIAGRVAGAVEPTLMFAEANRSSRKPTEDLQAYDLVLRALPHLIRVPTLADFRAGIALLDAAIARDPNYALAKAWKVRSYLVARGGRLISMAEFHEISPLAEALVNDYGNDPLVLAFASVAHGFGSDHQDEAAQAARRAVQLSPNSGLVMTSAGWPISYVAAYEEAIGCFERGIRLDPLGHTVGQCRVGIGGCLGFMGRYDDAVAILEQANADAPEYGTTVQGLIINYWAAGRHDDARRMADILRRMVADLTITSVLPTSPYRRPEQQALLIDAFRGVGIRD